MISHAVVRSRLLQSLHRKLQCKLQVGSILFTAEAGSSYQKGDELGYFAFGGSTCIAIFQKDTVVLDEDIVSNRYDMCLCNAVPVASRLEYM